jgi:hypothetical protein
MLTVGLVGEKWREMVRAPAFIWVGGAGDAAPPMSHRFHVCGSPNECKHWREKISCEANFR